MKRILLALCLALATGLRAEDWKPIPKEAWAVKEGAGGGASGAVILEESSRYGVNDSEFQLRIRIFNEAGRSAAQLDPFSQNLMSLQGRTVYPDGRQVVFNDKKDFAEQQVQVGAMDERRTVVVPPGITADCIVDLHWRLHATYLWGDHFDRWFLRPYPIRKLEIRLATMTPMASVLLGVDAHPPKVSEEDGYHLYAFQDLPALETIPYAITTMRDQPSLFCFRQPVWLRDAAVKGPDEYWRQATEQIYKATYKDEIKTNRTYRHFSEELRKNLPEDPLAKAQEILNRVNENILNLSSLTYEERAKRTKAQSEEVIRPLDLGEIVDRRATDGVGIHYLVYQLLVDAGIKPRLFFVLDRDVRSFRYKLCSIHQFTDVIIGVPAASGNSMALLQPSGRFFPPGVVSPDYQGTYALMVDTADWSFKPVSIPHQPPQVNQRTLLYDISLDSEGESFKVKAGFAGYPEYIERLGFLSLEPKEQSKKLKESMGNSLKSYTVSRAEVFHAQDPKLNMTWEVEGTRELESWRRHTVRPFPGAYFPLWVPDA